MSQKQKIVGIYKKEQTVSSFDRERKKYLFQRYKHDVEAKFLRDALIKEKKVKLKVLDVACGTGRMLPEVFSAGKKIEYHGIDTSKTMLSELNKKTGKMGWKRDIKTRVADAAKLPFDAGSFDVVFSFHLLWHLPKEDQKNIIKEMFRVTKKGGIIIFDILNKDFIWEKIKKYLGKNRSEGIYKLDLKEVRKIIKNKKFKLEKLSDAPIKNDALYKIFNSINKLNKILPSRFYHMIYIKIKCSKKD